MPKHWKLFFENPSCTSVLTVPYGAADATASDFANSTLMKPVDETLFNAICICLLSTKSTPEIESTGTKELTTPDAKSFHKRMGDSGERPPKRQSPVRVQASTRVLPSKASPEGEAPDICECMRRRSCPHKSPCVSTEEAVQVIMAEEIVADLSGRRSLPIWQKTQQLAFRLKSPLRRSP
jgi:hypothetical protein